MIVMRDFSALVGAADKSVAVTINDNLAALAPEINRELNVTKELKRAQVGFFHVWIRGSNRYNVFYNTTDFVGFLERCRMAAEKNQTVVSAFVLMDNHVHLQIYTRALNAFMKSLLMSFNQWYNRRRGMTGQLFNSPFSSKLIDNEDYLRYNFLYILTNPVRAGICENITQYRWSSYHFTKKGYNYLGKYIDVCNLVSNYLFKSHNDLHFYAYKFLKEYWSIVDGDNSAYSRIICASHYAKNIIKPTDYEVASNLDFILQGRKLNEISRDELQKTMKILRTECNATFRQISSVTHESYYDVVRMVKG